MKFRFGKYADFFELIKKAIAVLAAYCLAMIFFASTGGAWTSDELLALTQDQLKWWLLSIVIIACLLLLLFNSFQKIVFQSNVKNKLLVSFLCILTYFCGFYGDIKEYFVYFILTILWLELFLILTNDLHIIWNAFVNITVFFAFLSLVFYLLGTCFNFIPETGTTSLAWGVWDTSSIKTYFNLYYQSQFVNINGDTIIPRNCGIFSEAPMYNFVLCVALSVELFISKHIHYWKVILLIITILSTFSTTGYLFIIIAGLLYFSNIIFTMKGMTVHKIAFIVLLLLGLVIIVSIMLQKITSISGIGSVNVRSDHLFACLKAWKDSPIIGVGFQNQEAILAYAERKQGLSVGLTYFLAMGGMVLTSVILVPYFINGIEAAKKKMFDEFIFESLFLFLYFFTAITTYAILRLFIAYIIVVNLSQLTTSTKVDSLREKLNVIFSSRTYSVKNYLFYISRRKKSIFGLSIISGGLFCIFCILKNNRIFYWGFLYGLLAFVGVLLFMLLVNYIKYLKAES